MISTLGRVGTRATRATRRSRAGFSLVEVMVGVTVLLITIAGTLSSQVSANRLNQTAAETSAAMADLQAAMEQILLVPVAQLPIAGSDYEANLTIAAFDELHLTGESIRVSYPNYAGGTVPNPLEILLVITWQPLRGGTRTLQLACISNN